MEPQPPDSIIQKPPGIGPEEGTKPSGTSVLRNELSGAGSVVVRLTEESQTVTKLIKGTPAVAEIPILTEESVEIPGFTLLNRLGEGSMGAVFKAHNLATGQIVALKILFPHLLLGDSTFIKRFQEEANVAERLEHPNIVKVFQQGKAGAYYYITMEYVNGKTLRQLIAENGALSERLVALIGMCVASALDYAWGKEKLVHRDIKPENLLISNDGPLKLCDLGIAKRIDARAQNLTRTGMSLGSPHYIAPEQARAEKVIDFRVDIYALGATLYHAVTGETVHKSDSEFNIMYMHATQPVQDPRVRHPELSTQFSGLLMRMLKLDPNERFASWSEAFFALEAIYQDAPDDGFVKILKIV